MRRGNSKGSVADSSFRVIVWREKKEKRKGQHNQTHKTANKVKVSVLTRIMLS